MSIKAAALGGALLATALLHGQSDEFGEWITLFNGRDLSGWQVAKERQGPENRWTVEDGALTNIRGEVNDICTVREFEDYELEIEYRIPEKGNSGVYLRGQIEVQIYDSHRKIASGEPLTPADAGAIYGGRFVALKNVQKPPGEWNRYRVLHIGDRITVWHNGELIQDNVYQPNQTGGAMRRYPGREKPLETGRGPLMLQGDHTKVWYRNIRIRPLFGEGWKPLWNGKDLSEFNARKNRKAKDGLRWEVRDHAFTNTHTGGQGHDLWTNESFGNFLLYYAYRSDIRKKDDEGREIRDRSGNSGLYLRDQWEIQIHRHQKVGGKHSDGALYSIKGVDTHARHAPERWNHMFVELDGMKITVWQNGKLIHDGVRPRKRTDRNTATPKFTRAPFKLQGDHGKVWFTNLRIRPLPDDPGS